MNTSHYKFNKFIEFLKVRANKLKEDAAYNGDYSDGGASKILEQIRFWYYGAYSNFPPDWKNYEKEFNEKEFNKEIDPEYIKYLELKKKFE